MRNQMGQEKRTDSKSHWVAFYLNRFKTKPLTARVLAGACFFIGLLLGTQTSWSASAPAVRIINAKIDTAGHSVFTFDRVNSIQTSPVNLAANDILTVTQTWSEETDYVRTALVSAPPGDGPYPVVILLHGALGTATNFIGEFEYLSQIIRVVPQGYNNFWNVKSEGSQAPDVDFIRQIILQLRTYNNVDAGNIIILGYSNGAALANRLLIELDGALYQQGIKLAGQMNEIQFHDSAFWYDPTGGNAYDTQIQPARGRRILSLVGTADPVVPFAGGTGVPLPYYFLHAQDSIHEWAKQMGSTEAQIPDEDGVLVDTDTYEYSYLNGDVMMYKIVGADHHLNTFGEPHDDRTKKIIKGFLNLSD